MEFGTTVLRCFASLNLTHSKTFKVLSSNILQIKKKHTNFQITMKVLEKNAKRFALSHYFGCLVISLRLTHAKVSISELL